MEIRYIHFRENFFFYVLALLIIMIGIVSYYRFMVNHDYLVRYEGTCDPVTEKCFTGCEDDDCTEMFYYSEMVKYAPDLYRECGDDITDCEAASICLSEDRECSVDYCDVDLDDNICVIPVGKTDTSINDNIGSDEENLLQINETDNTI
ncbi:hypothetical protein KKG24_02995 [Patescibacteria group bacterium]|nr:hypothetical protein [Patescibacteria group bacterium]